MDETSYGDWRAAYWERPDLDPAPTSVAMLDGTAVTFCIASHPPTVLTGTSPG